MSLRLKDGIAFGKSAVATIPLQCGRPWLLRGITPARIISLQLTTTRKEHWYAYALCDRWRRYSCTGVLSRLTPKRKRLAEKGEPSLTVGSEPVSTVTVSQRGLIKGRDLQLRQFCLPGRVEWIPRSAVTAHATDELVDATHSQHRSVSTDQTGATLWSDYLEDALLSFSSFPTSFPVSPGQSETGGARENTPMRPGLRVFTRLGLRTIQV